MRDSDRSKVYGAEDMVRILLDSPGSTVQIAGTYVAVPDERKFDRLEDIQRYVDQVLEHVGDTRPVKVRRRQGELKATYRYATQTMSIPTRTDWAMRELVILHELSHHLTGPGKAGHGPEFRSNFCNLLEKVLAPEARFLLQVSYWEAGLTA